MASSGKLAKFQGCLVGAVVGDCIGAVFETLWADTISIEKVLKQVKKIDKAYAEKSNEGTDVKTSWRFTDDTAMARSVAASLLNMKSFDATDMARRFSTEYNKEPFRGYGGSVVTVFTELLASDCVDPFRPAQQQFDGQGSFGNGGAMRIAPAALFDFKGNDFNKLQSLVEGATRLTHTHYQAIQGAILQAWAVDLAIRMEEPNQADIDTFLCTLLERMTTLEQTMIDASLKAKKAKTQETDGCEKEENKASYCQKLKTIQQFLKQKEQPHFSDINDKLGTDIAALDSVPAAVYSFAYSSTKSPAGLEDMSPFEKTVLYAISLGGDSDTIATMAGAIAGACYGIDQIPASWQGCCEGVDQATADASSFYKMNFS